MLGSSQAPCKEAWRLATRRSGEPVPGVGPERARLGDARAGPIRGFAAIGARGVRSDRFSLGALLTGVPCSMAVRSAGHARAFASVLGQLPF